MPSGVYKRTEPSQKRLSHEQFLIKLHQNNVYFQNNELKILGKYLKNSVKILCEDKYGKLSVLPMNLLSGHKPTIRSAVNPTQYLINQFKEVHGSKYNYNKVDWINAKSNVIITCLIHGDFPQTSDGHLSGNGCPFCSAELTSKRINANPIAWNYSNWIKAAKNSKNFDSFKVYFLKIWNDTENFYKIGKTFGIVDGRFRCKECDSVLPYKYEILNIIESNTDGRYICELERELHKQHKKYQYTPKKQFDGMYECFSKIDWEKVAKLTENA